MSTMKRLRRELLPWLALVGVATLVCGCSAPRYRVTGTVTKGGKPLQWAGENGVLEVAFVNVDRQHDKKVYNAQTDSQTGAYTIPEIPAGTYRVAISQMDPYPIKDLLKVQYGLHNSPLVREVKADGEINIDLPAELPKAKSKDDDDE
jgi:hypothetical protein